jgi:acetolactate synthase-1/2/3 large subunit
MRVADFIARRLRFLGVDTAYMVTGGAAMHLNDAIAREYQTDLHFLHHEQSCAMAAESFARLTNRPCLVNVTAGPGGINALNGVFGSFVDSIPMIVVSGQAKRETLVVNANVKGLRQLGDQEVDIVNMASHVCKAAVLLQNPLDIRPVLNNLFVQATSARPGPVWLDIPIDVQGSVLPASFKAYINEPLNTRELAQHSFPKIGDSIDVLALHLLTDNRPVLYVGSGIRLSNSYNEFLAFLDQWPIACVTGWNSNDLLWDNHPCYVGRPGTVGNRTGNFAVQFSDCLLTVGCRLNIRQVSYNWRSFASRAWKCHVDIDRAELDKPTLSTNLKIHANCSGFFPALSAGLSRILTSRNLDRSLIIGHWHMWREWLQNSLITYAPVIEALPSQQGFVNPYQLVHKLTSLLPEQSICVCSDGTACVVGFQAAVFKTGQRMFHNSGCASMGYELPAAVGAWHATHQTVTCLAGDGSIMMNLQELAIIGKHQYSIKIVLINNEGYHSIRQTQQNYFADNIIGCGVDSGLPFPDFSSLARAFGLQYSIVRADSQLDLALQALYATPEPQIMEVCVSREQQFSPKLASKRLPNGQMVSSSLEDMSPHLPQEVFDRLLHEALNIKL